MDDTDEYPDPDIYGAQQADDEMEKVVRPVLADHHGLLHGRLLLDNYYIVV